MQNRQLNRTGVRRRGSFLVEFAIAASLLVLLSCGVFAVGINLDRYLAVMHLAQFASDVYRSSAHLDQAAVKQVLLKGTTGLGITAAGGQGVVYLSQISLASAGSNNGFPVITHRIVLGNAALEASSLGTPLTVDAQGHVSDYESDTSARAALPTGVTVVDGQTLYAVEVVESGTETAFEGWLAVSRMRAKSFF